MSPELIAIIGAAIALAAAILPGQYAMRRDIAGLHRDIAEREPLRGDLPQWVSARARRVYVVEREDLCGRVS